MIRSQWAFIRGARSAVFKVSMPSAAKTASKDPVYLASRSRIRNRNESTWAPSSVARFWPAARSRPPSDAR
jgi:hypothetical protein